MAASGCGSYGLWEWGGRTVSPHPHAHSTMVDSTMEKMLMHFQFWGVLTILLFITHADILPLSPLLGKNAHALAIRVPSIAVHSHAEGFFPVFFVFTHMILLDLPTQ